MSDAGMGIVLAIIFFSFVLLWLMRDSDYEDRRILSPGVYKVGKDIHPGRCDLVAESGNGNFVIKNKKANSWTLGNSLSAVGGMAPGSFRNVTLMRGDILEINGNLTVMLTPPQPIRNLKEETLGPGIYRIGVDGIRPAKYNFKAEGGNGEIVLVDIFDNSFSIFQNMGKGQSMAAGSYDNVVCSRRYEIWINGTLQVKLTRSKKQYLITGHRKAN